jgi:hypothetical protein
MSVSDLWPAPSLIMWAIAWYIVWRFRRYKKWNKEQQEFQFALDSSVPLRVWVWVGITFALTLAGAVLFPRPNPFF